jgi:hypothetical protein
MHDYALLICVNPYKLFTNLPLAFFLYFSNLITNKKFKNMRFIPLIMVSNFIQVLNSLRNFYTKN